MRTARLILLQVRHRGREGTRCRRALTHDVQRRWMNYRWRCAAGADAANRYGPVSRLARASWRPPPDAE
jgi:hypothetical protein